MIDFIKKEGHCRFSAGVAQIPFDYLTIRLDVWQEQMFDKQPYLLTEPLKITNYSDILIQFEVITSHTGFISGWS